MHGDFVAATTYCGRNTIVRVAPSIEWSIYQRTLAVLWKSEADCLVENVLVTTSRRVKLVAVSDVI